MGDAVEMKVSKDCLQQILSFEEPLEILNRRLISKHWRTAVRVALSRVQSARLTNDNYQIILNLCPNLTSVDNGTQWIYSERGTQNGVKNALVSRKLSRTQKESSDFVCVRFFSILILLYISLFVFRCRTFSPTVPISEQ